MSSKEKAKENAEFSRTLRERTIDLLMKNPGKTFTAKEMCEILEVENESEIYAVLKQVARILRRKGIALVFSQPVCKKCGFVMSKIYAKKCPRCKSEWIEPAKFMVRL